MALKGKLTPVTPRLISVVEDLIKTYGSRAELARAAGSSRTPFNDLMSGELTFMHAVIVRKLIKLHPTAKITEFEFYTRKQLRNLYGLWSGQKPIVIKRINGISHRECKFKEHRGDRWLPLEQFSKSSKTQTPRPWCKKCETLSKGLEPLWPIDHLIMTAMRGVSNRIGKIEAARRMGISEPAFFKILNGKQNKVRRSTARKILRTWHEIQQSGEVRHRDSIHHGATKRGRIEKPVTKRDDLYARSGDIDSEIQRRARRREADLTEAKAS